MSIFDRIELGSKARLEVKLFEYIQEELSTIVPYTTFTSINAKSGFLTTSVAVVFFEKDRMYHIDKNFKAIDDESLEYLKPVATEIINKVPYYVLLKKIRDDRVQALLYRNDDNQYIRQAAKERLRDVNADYK